jgi:hypothetical protein
MAGQRTVTGTIRRPNGGLWKGAEIRIRPVDDTFTVSPDATYPKETLRVATDDAGAFTLVLASGTNAEYEVTLPDGETFRIVVPDGAATTLELLRAAYLGPPAAIDNVQTVVEALLADPAVIAAISHEDISDIGTNTHPQIDTHLGSTAAHGATGAVVGTTNAQTLTNKSLTSPVITTPTGIVKGDVGLGNVDNTSDTTKNSAVATLTNKTLTAPTIADFTNMAHDHLDADDGGTLSAAAIAAGTIALARLGTGTPDTSKFLRGDNAWVAPPAAGSPALDDLSDVAIAAAANGQMLAYLGGWKNADMLRLAFASGPPVTGSSSAGLATAHQTTLVLPAGTWEITLFAAVTLFNTVVAANNCAFQIGAPVVGTTSYTNGATANDVHASVAAAQTTVVSNGVAATTFRSEFAPVSGTLSVQSGALVALCRRTA